MTALQGFNCNYDLSLLAADMREPCPTQHTTHFIFGWSIFMTVVYAAGIPVFFYVLAKVYKVDHIAKELTYDEYLRSLLVAYSQEARPLHSVLTNSLGVGEGPHQNIKHLLAVCAGLLDGLRIAAAQQEGQADTSDSDELSERACPECDKLSKAWKHANLPEVRGLAHLRGFADRLKLAEHSLEHATVETVMSTVLNFVEEASMLLKVYDVKDLTEEHFKVLARQDWNAIVPRRKDSCYLCRHSTKVGVCV
jgi:hypothetical protein